MTVYHDVTILHKLLLILSYLSSLEILESKKALAVHEPSPALSVSHGLVVAQEG